MDAERLAEQPNRHPAEGAQPERRHVEQADHAPAHVERGVDLHQRLRHRGEGKLEESRGEQKNERDRVISGGGEAEQGCASAIATPALGRRRAHVSSATPATIAPSASAASSML